MVVTALYVIAGEADQSLGKPDSRLLWHIVPGSDKEVTCCQSHQGAQTIDLSLARLYICSAGFLAVDCLALKGQCGSG